MVFLVFISCTYIRFGHIKLTSSCMVNQMSMCDISLMPTVEVNCFVQWDIYMSKLKTVDTNKIHILTFICPDPVVRVTLLHDGKAIKKKKTSVRKGCQNPVWNEALVFNVPPASLKHVSLELAVADHDLLGHSEYVAAMYFFNYSAWFIVTV